MFLSCHQSNELQPRHRGSYISDRVSPATSIDSLKNVSPTSRSHANLGDATNPSFSIATHANPPNGVALTSFSNNPAGPIGNPSIPRRFFDDTQTVFLSWNTLVEDMRRAVQRYREAIENADKAVFVKRAEDISDHLRLLLAAGSGTTDNHSGNPSIISTNKALYPHFREMMSSFSKLVLSSHFAAADFTTPESFAKCMQEAEGLLHGVYGYVEIARAQRGEEIPRLTPGFVLGSRTGGAWQNNGVVFDNHVTALPFLSTDSEIFLEPTARLDSESLDRLDHLKKLVSTSIRRVDEQLVLREKLITPRRHRKIGDNVCIAASRTLEVCRPYVATVESINLKPLGSSANNPQLMDLAEQKQRFYDSTSELVVACQTVASPLSDEWSAQRGSSLEDRVNHVRMVLRDMETFSGQLNFSLQLLSEMIPPDSGIAKEEPRKTTGDVSPYTEKMRSGSVAPSIARSTMATDDSGSDVESRRNNSKINRFFGEVPLGAAPRESEDMPEFLRLDHEGEISYETKFTPPQLRGGTLTGLIEQLTRHDRLDPAFNNTFLLTYRSFTTAAELFEMLVKRWSVQPPYGLAASDLQTWTDKKQKPIRFRVVNILKSWFDNYWMESNDEPSQQLMQRVYKFANETVTSTSTPGAGPLKTAVEQRLRGHDNSNKRMVLTLNSASTPTPIVPKNLKKLKFLDIDALEFARQLTVIESRLYYKIKPTECLNKTWQKKILPDEPDPASNVKALILHSNQLTNWVAQMILTQADVKRRVIVIKHFVSVADVCIRHDSTRAPR